MSIMHIVAALFAVALQNAPSPPGLVGVWVNVDPKATGITKLEVRMTRGGIEIQSWGKCYPSPCDKGTSTAERFFGDTDPAKPNVPEALLVRSPARTLAIVLRGDELQTYEFTSFAKGDPRRPLCSHAVLKRSR